MTLLNWCVDYLVSVTSCSSSYDWSYLTTTGWYLWGGPVNWATLVDQWTCKGDTYMDVRNDTFRCPAQAHVVTSYADNEMLGNHNLGYCDNSYYYSYGTCSNLLTWHHIIYASPL